MRLVISPHIDDEVLGCSSVLDKDTCVYYLGVNKFHVVSAEERKEEARNVSEYFGFRLYLGNHPVDKYDMQTILDTIQQMINQCEPTEIYIPRRSYNQDHRTTFDACFSALRVHDKNFFVKKVFVYEQIHPNLWDLNEFKPNHFKEVDIDKKINGYCLHASQVRGHRSQETIRLLARWRGLQSGFPFAEAFKILRWID